MTRKKLAVAALVLDYQLHPRHHLDLNNVQRLTEVIEAGGELPPPVIDLQSNRVVDGFHRVTAYGKIDPDRKILVDARKFATSADMLRFAIQANAAHGLKLGTWDRTRCLLLAEEHGLSVEDVAKALTVSVDVLAKLRATKTAKTPTGKPMSIKRPLRSLAGQQLSEKQVEGNRYSSGWPVRFHVDQVINALQHDFPISEDAVEQMLVLRDLLTKYLDDVTARTA